MSRVNVMTWPEGLVLTRKMAKLQEALIAYQPHAYNARAAATHPNTTLGGDSDVMVAAIELRDRLISLIEKSKAANG